MKPLLHASEHTTEIHRKDPVFNSTHVSQVIRLSHFIHACKLPPPPLFKVKYLKEYFHCYKKKYEFTQRSTATPRGSSEIGILVFGAVQTHLKSNFILKDLQTYKIETQNRGVRKNNKQSTTKRLYQLG